MKKTIILLALPFLLTFAYTQENLKNAITDFPWTEGFESLEFPPSGWTIIEVSGIRTWTRNTDYAHSGGASAEHGWLAGSVQATALITPPITLPNTGTPELDFWSRIQLIGYNNSSKILISTTVNTTLAAFTEVKVLSPAETPIAQWVNINIPLDAYLGQTIYIAFLYTADDGPRWFIDDVTISHFDSFIDMQAVSVTPISGNYAILSANEQITVRLKNNGGQPASGFPIKLIHNDNVINTEIFTGTIPSMGETTYTFNTTLNLSASGTHKIQAEVNITGDQVPANNTATSTVVNLGCEINTIFPFFEGFEDNENNLPTCWTQEFVAKNFNWRIFNETGANIIPGLQPKTAFDGEFKAVFYTNGKDGAITKLITPPMDITAMANPVLKFHHIQQQYAGDQDSLKVYYKNAPNSAWVFLEKYTMTLTDWTERVIPLPEPSSHYYIAFEAYAEYGHSVQLDNIIVNDYAATDIEVKAINPSGTHLGLSAQQPITATIKNNGRNTVTGFTLTLYFQENFVVTETFTGTIPGLGEATYTFSPTLDLSFSGTYMLTVVADLQGDEIPENNELTVFVKNIVCNALPFPYEEGFEEETFPPPCWKEEGGWQRLAYGAHSGFGRASYAWWYGSLGWLKSPKLSIPANGESVLEFWSYVYEARFYTHSEVMISTTDDHTSSFTILHTLTGSEVPESVWTKITIPLNAYAGQDIYLAFRYRNNGGQTGHMWSVDDINIYNSNSSFIPVSNIIGVPAFANTEVSLPLTGTIIPSNATNKSIIWTIHNAGTTGATITGSNTLNTTEAGILVVRATILNGTADGVDFIKDFEITVSLNIEENKNDNIKVYSFLNSVFIKDESNVPVKSVEIFDIMGRVIYKGTTTNRETAIPLHVSNGIYAVKLITSEGKMLVRKVWIHK